jgi:hypothetical protein
LFHLERGFIAPVERVHISREKSSFQKEKEFISERERVHFSKGKSSFYV